jgi:hypothetical protein
MPFYQIGEVYNEKNSILSAFLELTTELGIMFLPIGAFASTPRTLALQRQCRWDGIQDDKEGGLELWHYRFWDIYMTKDDRIIFYGERLWISDPDTLSITPITPYNLVMFDKPQLEFTRDGETAYFAASRDLYRMKLSTNEPFKITETPEDYYWAEPMLSDNERYISIRGYWGKKGESETSTLMLISLTTHCTMYSQLTMWLPPTKGKSLRVRTGFS